MDSYSGRRVCLAVTRQALMSWQSPAVQTLHVMLQDCVECMGVGANMARSDNIAEEGTRAVSAIAQGASVAKELGDVRCVPKAFLLLTQQNLCGGSSSGGLPAARKGVQATVMVLYLDQMALGSCNLAFALALIGLPGVVLPAADAYQGKHMCRRFLNRLLGLPVARQNLLFSYFACTLAAEIRAAKAEGRYYEGVSDLGGSHVSKVEPQVLL